MQSDESRQGALQGALTAVNYTVKSTLAAAKANFTAAKNLKINLKLEQPEPIHYSEKGFSLQ